MPCYAIIVRKMRRTYPSQEYSEARLLSGQYWERRIKKEGERYEKKLPKPKL